LNLPETEKLVNECISLPIYPTLTEQELEIIANAVTQVADLLL
jgi:dTDP-4-amino-4,6-dideoxygalactose transaminase